MATGYYLLDNRTTIPQCGKTRRNGAKASGTIILHDAEGGTDLSGADMGAENVARFIAERDTYGSYHDLVDRDTHIPMAPIDYETWHSVPDNPWTVGICVAWTKADLPKMTYAQRRSYYAPLARVVLKRVADFARRGITVPIDRMLTAAETQARRPGISTHSRTDPSRRSDPFGTGSVYEREFLAVLAELAKTTNPQQEDELSAAAEAKLDRILKILDGPFTDEIDGKDREIDLGTSQDRVLALARRNEALIRRVLAAVLAKTTVEIDADGAKLIADAIPDDIAQDVADTLYARLAK